MNARIRSGSRRPRAAAARALASALALTMAAPTSAFARRVADVDDLAAFLAAYHCSLMKRLARLEDPDVRKDMADDRFLILANEDRPAEENYVQCIVAPDDTETYCEASSGFYAAETAGPRTTFLPPAAVATLARLGFSTDDSKGNFQRKWKNAAGRPDLDALADIMLSTLYAAFGARRNAAIIVNSPAVAPGSAPLPADDCPVVS
jgi:hypothetical protein